MLRISSRAFSLAQHVHLKLYKPNRIGFALFEYPLRLKSSKKSDNPPTPANDLPDTGESNAVLEVYDVPYENQWEVDPQFEYTGQKPPSFSYDFVTSNELFELEELKMVLKQENIRDLLFLSLPANHIAGYMVIGSGSSARHVRSTADLIYRILKYKRRGSLLGIPRVEGLDGSGEWIAIHLGNILLHLFLPSVRMYYNLESLWVAGARFDEFSQLGRSETGLNLIDAPNRSVDWEQILKETQELERLDVAVTRFNRSEETSKPTEEH